MEFRVKKLVFQIEFNKEVPPCRTFSLLLPARAMNSDCGGVRFLEELGVRALDCDLCGPALFLPTNIYMYIIHTHRIYSER